MLAQTGEQAEGEPISALKGALLGKDGTPITEQCIKCRQKIQWESS
jgi:hypothetical protein